MYTEINFKSKKELKEAVKAGRKIMIYNVIFPAATIAGCSYGVEGPHAPKPHTWCATVTLGDDLCIKTVK